MPITPPKHADDVEAFLLRWAQSWLDEAARNGRTNELPYCARALEHLHSRQAGRPQAVMIGLRPRNTNGAQHTNEGVIAA